MGGGRMMGLRVAGLVLSTALAAQTAPAADLALLRSFSFEGPSGLAYDPSLCALWIANETREVVLVNLWGEELSRFTSVLPRVDAIAVAGDDLLLSDGSGTYHRVSRTGAEVAAPFQLPIALKDADGLFFDDDTQDIWITDDSASLVARVRADGRIRQRVDGLSQDPPLAEPQGLTRDPASGNILVVDDADGSDSLFEFSASGALLDVVPLAAGGLHDAEGISIQPDTSTVFVAFDLGNAVAVYRYGPSLTAHALRQTAPGNCLLSAFQFEKPPV